MFWLCGFLFPMLFLKVSYCAKNSLAAMRGFFIGYVRLPLVVLLIILVALNGFNLHTVLLSAFHFILSIAGLLTVFYFSLVVFSMYAFFLCFRAECCG
jgi:hypothetical protein